MTLLSFLLVGLIVSSILIWALCKTIEFLFLGLLMVWVVFWFIGLGTGATFSTNMPVITYDAKAVKGENTVLVESVLGSRIYDTAEIFNKADQIIGIKVKQRKSVYGDIYKDSEELVYKENDTATN